MDTTRADEALLSGRYKDRQDWPDNYRYKDVKGARYAQVMRESGGLPPRALEIGVGRGGVAVAVSRQGPAVIGLELSPDILRKAQDYARNTSVRLLQGSGFALPFRNGSLPLVYASQVLHLFDSPSRRSVMGEAFRVLASGGRFLFDMKNIPPHVMGYLASSPEKRQRNYPPDAELRAQLQDAGFSRVIVKPGVMPWFGWTNVPDLGLLRAITHTRFYVAIRD
jgi:ubiquinone/menaquinone biosynthesis C-methylase UbiE